MGRLARVYRKPTHLDRYLNANSHHHPAQKIAVLNTLVHQACEMSDRDSWKDEKLYLYRALGYGFRKKDVDKAFLRVDYTQGHSTGKLTSEKGLSTIRKRNER